MEENMASDDNQLQPTRTTTKAVKRGRRRPPGQMTLAHLDGRTRAARRARELIANLEVDLGGGDLPEAQRLLVQRAALTAAMCEASETSWLAGEDVDLPQYLATINVLRRVLTSLGLQRVPRDVTTTIEHYVRMRDDEAKQ